MARAAEDNLYEVDDLLNQPGTYFNPQTEVLVIVDDSASLDQEVFNMEEYEGADWVLISDDSAIDESRRDELLEAFQRELHPAPMGDDDEEESFDEGEEDEPSASERE